MRVGDRSCNVMQSVEFGQSEKSIIKQPRDHYATIHPTQKPVRLLERLLALVTKEGDIILDPFGRFGLDGHCLHGYGEGFHRIRDRQGVLCQSDGSNFETPTEIRFTNGMKKYLFIALLIVSGLLWLQTVRLRGERSERKRVQSNNEVLTDSVSSTGRPAANMPHPGRYLNSEPENWSGTMRNWPRRSGSCGSRSGGWRRRPRRPRGPRCRSRRPWNPQTRSRRQHGRNTAQGCEGPPIR